MNKELLQSLIIEVEEFIGQVDAFACDHTCCPGPDSEELITLIEELKEELSQL